MMEVRHFPIFDERPDDAFISAWHDHIRDTGYPELMENVSTAKPYDMEGVVILSGELRVPTVRREDQSFVPCPLCAPHSPKFGTGRMAWFPLERTALFIGHKCARRHMGDEYQRAEERFNKESKCRRYIAAWPEMQERRATLVDLCERAMPAATAVESARTAFDREAPGFIRFLANELVWENGVLKISRDSGLKDNRGRGIMETFVLGTVQGMNFLSGMKPAAKLRESLRVLDDVALPLPEWSAQGMEEDTTEEVIQRGHRALSVLKAIGDVLTSLRDSQRFLDAENLDLLVEWGNTGQSPFSGLQFRRKGSWVFLRAESFEGRYEASFSVPDAIRSDVPGNHPLLRAIA